MKAQVSMEYSMIAVTIALKVIPLAFIAFSFSKSSSAEISQGQINKLGDDIVKTSEKIFYQGYPSRITLEGTMPDGVTEIRIDKDWNSGQNELVFVTYFNSVSSEFSYPSRVNIAGDFQSESFSPGQKRIRIESVDDSTPYVLITIT